MPRALEQIRRMRGGAQAHLMRCHDAVLHHSETSGVQDTAFYVVKFQNNPQAAQGGRILANELLGSRLAARMGLPVPRAEVVEVTQDLINLTADLEMQLGHGRERCRAGMHFGSRYPADPARTAVHDFLPDEQLREVTNLSDFAGALAFDKWACNTNGRQAIFVHDSAAVALGAAPGMASPSAGQLAGKQRYRALFIDFGFCFNAGEWSFPDAPLRGIYARHRVYEGVTGLDSFEPWLTRIEKLGVDALDQIAREIPPEWFADDHDALYRLLEQLDRRRKRVRELILDAKHSYRQPL